MELNAEGRMLLVLHAHDLAATIGSVCPRRNVELGRERIVLNHKAMISSGSHGLRKAGEDALPLVVNLIRLAVH